MATPTMLTNHAIGRARPLARVSAPQFGGGFATVGGWRSSSFAQAFGSRAAADLSIDATNTADACGLETTAPTMAVPQIVKPTARLLGTRST